MKSQLELSILKVLNVQGSPIGVGFLVATGLVVTCAHVALGAGSSPGKFVRLEAIDGGVCQQGLVLEQGWSSPEHEDIAFVKLRETYMVASMIPLDTASGSQGHQYRSVGFPKFAGYQMRWITGEIAGIVPAPNKRPMLQLSGDGVRGGVSGGPVFDVQTERIVGMISEYKDDSFQRYVWATTVDTLCTIYPDLVIEPAPRPRSIPMNEIFSQDRLINLKKILENRLNMHEVRDLCFELGIDFDNLPEGGKNDKIREIVQYLNRRGALIHLLTLLGHFRPDIDTSNL